MTTKRTSKKFKITPELISKIDEVAARGFSLGAGKRKGQMCVEAAICYALGEPHGDQPSCVAQEVRRFKIALNDSLCWRSARSRAKGLRDIAIAQLGSKGVVNGREFAKRLSKKTIYTLIPALFREIFTDTSDPKHQACLEAADRCEREGSSMAAGAAGDAARTAAWAAAARDAAAWAVDAADAADAAWAVDAADDAADVADWAARAAKCKGVKDPEKYLRMSANLALETLRELGSPGCKWISKKSRKKIKKKRK